MKFNHFILWLLLGFNVTSEGVLAQHQWKLEKDKNGIKVYSKESDSSKFKSVKVECTIDGSLEKLIAVMMNVPGQTNWVYETKTAKVVKPISETELIYYTETTLPFPVKNRDAVIHLTLKKDENPNKLKIFQISENGVYPPQKGIVRIKSMNGTYYVTQENGKLHIVYYLDIDPAGSLPAWIVNMFSSTGPYETFLSLGEELKK